MMWTFMLAGLACGSRIILYDGSPFHPDLKTYLQFINDQGSVMTLHLIVFLIRGQGFDPRNESKVLGRNPGKRD